MCKTQRQNRFDSIDLRRGQCQMGCLRRFMQMRHRPRTRDDDAVLALGQHPSLGQDRSQYLHVRRQRAETLNPR